MKALHDRTQELQGQRGANDLAARVELIFTHYPMLCGFSVQECSTLSSDHAIVELQGGLCLADVTLESRLEFRAAQELCSHIAYALIELMDGQPEVSQLLPGRTFARTLH
jgi:hypothetical protein